MLIQLLITDANNVCIFKTNEMYWKPQYQIRDDHWMESDYLPYSPSKTISVTHSSRTAIAKPSGMI